jgi:hypothetical protein
MEVENGTLQVGDTITFIAIENQGDHPCSGCFFENKNCHHDYNGSICCNHEDKINIILKRVF